MIEDNFTSKNMLALIVPTGDYDKESAILDELGQYDEVDSTMGLTNIEALDGYMLADKLTPRQFAELAGLDYEAAQVVYAAYAAQQAELSAQISELQDAVRMGETTILDWRWLPVDKLHRDADKSWMPVQVQVIGFDNNEEAPYLQIPLTTMDSRLDWTAPTAVDRILGRIDGSITKSELLTTESQVIARASTR